MLRSQTSPALDIFSKFSLSIAIFSFNSPAFSSSWSSFLFVCSMSFFALSKFAIFLLRLSEIPFQWTSSLLKRLPHAPARFLPPYLSFPSTRFRSADSEDSSLPSARSGWPPPGFSSSSVLSCVYFQSSPAMKLFFCRKSIQTEKKSYGYCEFFLSHSSSSFEFQSIAPTNFLFTLKFLSTKKVSGNCCVP
jgi:hypothetical protein